jgi:hypothetical protein
VRVVRDTFLPTGPSDRRRAFPPAPGLRDRIRDQNGPENSPVLTHRRATIVRTVVGQNMAFWEEEASRESGCRALTSGIWL